MSKDKPNLLSISTHKQVINNPSIESINISIQNSIKNIVSNNNNVALKNNIMNVQQNATTNQLPALLKNPKRISKRSSFHPNGLSNLNKNQPLQLEEDKQQDQQLSYQTNKLSHYIQLQLADLQNTLHYIQKKHSLNQIKQSISHSYNIFSQTEPIFKELKINFVYQKMKKLVNCFSIIYLILMQHIQKPGKYSLGHGDTQRDKNSEKGRINTQQSNIALNMQNNGQNLFSNNQRNSSKKISQFNNNGNYQSVSLYKNVQNGKQSTKPRVLGGIHLYNQQYNRYIEPDHHRDFKRKNGLLNNVQSKKLKYKNNPSQSNDILRDKKFNQKKKLRQDIQQQLNFQYSSLQNNNKNDLITQRGQSHSNLKYSGTDQLTLFFNLNNNRFGSDLQSVTFQDQLQQIANFFKQSQDQALQFLNKSKNDFIFMSINQGFKDALISYKQEKKSQVNMFIQKVKGLFQLIKLKAIQRQKQINNKLTELKLLQQKLIKPQTKQWDTQTTYNIEQQIAILNKRYQQLQNNYQALKQYRKNSNQSEQSNMNLLQHKLVFKQRQISFIKNQLQQKSHFINFLIEKIKQGTDHKILRKISNLYKNHAAQSYSNVNNFQQNSKMVLKIQLEQFQKQDKLLLQGKQLQKTNKELIMRNSDKSRISVNSSFKDQNSYNKTNENSTNDLYNNNNNKDSFEKNSENNNQDQNFNGNNRRKRKPTGSFTNNSGLTNTNGQNLKKVLKRMNSQERSQNIIQNNLTNLLQPMKVKVEKQKQKQKQRITIMKQQQLNHQQQEQNQFNQEIITHENLILKDKPKKRQSINKGSKKSQQKRTSTDDKKILKNNDQQSKRNINSVINNKITQNNSKLIDMRNMQSNSGSNDQNYSVNERKINNDPKIFQKKQNNSNQKITHNQIKRNSLNKFKFIQQKSNENYSSNNKDFLESNTKFDNKKVDQQGQQQQIQGDQYFNQNSLSIRQQNIQNDTSLKYKQHLKLSDSKISKNGLKYNISNQNFNLGQNNITNNNNNEKNKRNFSNLGMILEQQHYNNSSIKSSMAQEEFMKYINGNNESINQTYSHSSSINNQQVNSTNKNINKEYNWQILGMDNLQNINSSQNQQQYQDQQGEQFEQSSQYQSDFRKISNQSQNSSEIDSMLYKKTNKQYSVNDFNKIEQKWNYYAQIYKKQKIKYSTLNSKMIDIQINFSQLNKTNQTIQKQMSSSVNIHKNIIPKVSKQQTNKNDIQSKNISHINYNDNFNQRQSQINNQNIVQDRQKSSKNNNKAFSIQRQQKINYNNNNNRQKTANQLINDKFNIQINFKEQNIDSLKKSTLRQVDKQNINNYKNEKIMDSSDRNNNILHSNHQFSSTNRLNNSLHFNSKQQQIPFDFTLTTQKIQQFLQKSAIIMAMKCRSIQQFKNRIKKAHKLKCGQNCKHLQRYLSNFNKYKNHYYKRQVMKVHIENMHQTIEDNIESNRKKQNTIGLPSIGSNTYMQMNAHKTASSDIFSNIGNNEMQSTNGFERQNNMALTAINTTTNCVFPQSNSVHVNSNTVNFNKTSTSSKGFSFANIPTKIAKR